MRRLIAVALFTSVALTFAAPAAGQGFNLGPTNSSGNNPPRMRGAPNLSSQIDGGSNGGLGGGGGYNPGPAFNNNSNQGAQIAGAILGGLMQGAAQQAQRQQQMQQTAPYRPDSSSQWNSNSGGMYRNNNYTSRPSSGNPTYYNNNSNGYYSNSGSTYSRPVVTYPSNGPTYSSGGTTYQPAVSTGSYNSTAVALPKNTIPTAATPSYSGDPIKVKLPKTAAGQISYVLNEYTYTIKAGESQTLKYDRDWKLRFDDGSGKEKSYSLGGGTYEFRLASGAWDLYRTSPTVD